MCGGKITNRPYWSCNNSSGIYCNNSKRFKEDIVDWYVSHVTISSVEHIVIKFTRKRQTFYLHRLIKINKTYVVIGRASSGAVIETYYGDALLYEKVSTR